MCRAVNIQFVELSLLTINLDLPRRLDSTWPTGGSMDRAKGGLDLWIHVS